MKTSGWKFIDTGLNSGEYNMRFDERLAQTLSNGEGSPTLRFFQWSPWAISLGYNQDESDIDAQRCRHDGIDIVRRPTGGRAILHAEELTYSVVMYAERRSVLEVYNLISSALVRGLREFGVEATLQRSQPNFREQYAAATGVACFTSSARYEIEWQGKKLVGSAQRRFGGERDVVLQHGSILCGRAHEQLVRYLTTQTAVESGLVGEELRVRTADLGTITGSTVDIRRLSRCLRAGFEEEFDILFDEHSHLPTTQTA